MIPAAGYRIVKTNGGETLSDIAAREGIPYAKGSGFFQLQKKESVSADKILILFNGSSFVTEGVRQLLGVGPGKVDIVPSKVPPGSLLFVNSTSPNRKVDAGEVLFQTNVAAPAAAPKRGRTGKAKEGRKKQKGSDDEGKEDGDGGDDAAPEGAEDLDGFGLIQWGKITEESVEDGWEKEEVLKQVEGAWNEINKPVPQHLLDAEFNTLVRVFREFRSWALSKKDEWDGCVIPQRRFQWTAKNGSARARLLYYGSDAGLITAVEVDAWKFALLVAHAQAEANCTLIRARTFSYTDTEASTPGTWVNDNDKQPTSEQILANMMRDMQAWAVGPNTF